MNPTAIDREAVKRDFSHAADTYDRYASFQQQIVRSLVTMCEGQVGPASQVLDAGCGTGYLARYIRQQNIPWQLLQLDIAEGMAGLCMREGWPTVCADMASVPLRDASLDAVFSSLALQWVETPRSVFQEFQRVLRPGGTLALATLAQGTLRELHEAWERIGQASRVLHFVPGDALLAMARESGFTIEEDAMARHVRRYASLRQLMLELGKIGAGHKPASSYRQPDPSWMKALRLAYPTTETESAIGARFEVCYMLCVRA